MVLLLNTINLKPTIVTGVMSGVTIVMVPKIVVLVNVTPIAPS